jgi:hypothetical protein
VRSQFAVDHRNERRDKAEPRNVKLSGIWSCHEHSLGIGTFFVARDIRISVDAQSQGETTLLSPVFGHRVSASEGNTPALLREAQ